MTGECIVAEKTIKIPCDELQTIRFVCRRQNCGGVVEFPTNRLGAIVGQLVCPSCNQAFQMSAVGGVGGLRALGLALENVVGKNDFRAEFVIPSP
jgi:hypothetical protein